MKEHSVNFLNNSDFLKKWESIKNRLEMAISITKLATSHIVSLPLHQQVKNVLIGFD
jgi:hypothetical protein